MLPVPGHLVTSHDLTKLKQRFQHVSTGRAFITGGVPKACDSKVRKSLGTDAVDGLNGVEGMLNCGFNSFTIFN